MTVAAAPLQDLDTVQGQHLGRRALEVAAAGGHSLLFVGPPGAGKVKLARCLPDLLPPMSDEEAAEVAEIYSRTGGMEPPPCRPFRSPHPAVSAEALAGRGRHRYPGELSLAHAGVLFLDDLPEISRSSLEAVCQALDEGKVHPDLPARFHLVAAMTLCPCGGWGEPQSSCRCSEDLRSRYLRRVRFVLDRIEITVETPALTWRDLKPQLTESTDTVARRVAAARYIQADRCGKVNGALSPAEVEEHCSIDSSADWMLRLAIERLQLDEGAVLRIRKVARTVADLYQSHIIRAAHLGEAIQYRTMRPATD